MSKKTNLLKNTLVLAFGKITTQLAALILLPLYTFYLSPEQYGFYDLVITYIALLAPLLTVQMEMAVFRHLIDVRKSKKGQISVVSSVAEIVSISIVIIITGALVLNLLVEVPYLLQITTLLITTALSQVTLQVARGLGSNKTFAIASIILALMTLATALLFVGALQFGVVGIFYSLIIANVFTALYVAIVHKIWELIRVGRSQSILKKSILSYAIPLVPNSAALWIIQASDRTIISLFIDVAANGIYAVGSKLPLALSGFFSVFNMSWTEAVSLHINSKDKDRDEFLSSAFNTGIKTIASLGLLLVAIVPFVFPLVIGGEFQESTQYIPLLTAGVVISAGMSMFGAVYVARKMTKKVATTSIVVAVTNIILTTSLIPLFGLYGAAVATIISYGMAVVVRYFDLKKYINLTYDVAAYLLLTLAYVFVSGVYHLSNSFLLNLINLLIVCVIVCIVSKDELRKAIKKVRGKIQL